MINGCVKILADFWIYIIIISVFWEYVKSFKNKSRRERIYAATGNDAHIVVS